MNTYYPRIYLPLTLRNFYTNWILNVEKLLKPEEPIKPETPKEPQKISFDILGLIVTYLFPSFLIYTFSKEFGYVLIGFISWCIFYVGFYFNQKNLYIKNIKIYKKELLIYEDQLQNYQQNMKLYLQKIEELQFQLKNIAWREGKRIEINNLLMNPVKKPILLYKNVKRGKSEFFFESILNNFFSNEIFDKSNYRSFQLL